jgi:hypothetical protein
MDIAKFCPATQGWSTHESREPELLLRVPDLAKQEGDHAPPPRAMALRERLAASRAQVNRLMVKSGKSRMPPRFE